MGKTPRRPTLSNSSLGVYVDCPRCFWLEKNMRIKRPRGPFPSLPGGMDQIIKVYFDRHRAAGTVPPEIAELLPGYKLYADQEKLRKMRNWQSAPRVPIGTHDCIWALDDLLVDADGLHSPLDYKTKAGEPKMEASVRYYNRQLNVYSFALDHAKLKTNGKGHLLYYYPAGVSENGVVQFKTMLHTMDTNPSKAQVLFSKAVLCLKSSFPAAGGACEYCGHMGSIAQNATKIANFTLPKKGAQPSFLD